MFVERLLLLLFWVIAVPTIIFVTWGLVRGAMWLLIHAFLLLDWMYNFWQWAIPL